MSLKTIVINLFLPIRGISAGAIRKGLKNYYSKKKTLKHDEYPDLKAKLLNPLHQLFVGSIPDEFSIMDNKLKFSSKGGLMSIQAYYVGQVEYHLTNYVVTHLLKDNMVFLDIGGHHGAFSLIVAKGLQEKGYQGDIYCFEPDPVNIAFIKKNLDLNHLNEFVTIIPNAVSNHKGNFNLVTPGDNSCNWLESSSDPAGNYNVVTVKTETIDRFCDNLDRLDLVKIDIQGGELSALQGARETIKKHRPVLIIEIMNYSKGANATKEFLESLGYKLYYLSEDSTLLKKGDPKIFVSWDVVAFYEPQK